MSKTLHMVAPQITYVYCKFASQNGVVCFWIHTKNEFNIMSASFSNILSTFSPLHLNRRESVSTSGGKGVSGEVVAVAMATTAGVIGGGDDVSDGDDGDNWWEKSLELLVAEAAVMALSLTSGRTVGRASKRQQVGGDEPIQNVTKLGSLTRASKLSMNDDDLINYFTAHLEGTEMAMECINTACDCLSVLNDKNVRQAVALVLV